MLNRKRKVRVLYRDACVEYQRGALNAARAKQSGKPHFSLSCSDYLTPARDAGYRDFERGRLRRESTGIDPAVWAMVLAEWERAES